MGNVFIGPGNLHGKGVYASRPFRKGEVIKRYNIRTVSEEEFAVLLQEDRESTHTRNGIMYLYGEPDRYTNHSDSPNTIQDFENQSDVALRDIEKGEMITTDSSREDF